MTNNKVFDFKYTYEVYGLTIESDIEITEFVQVNNNSKDDIIRIKKIIIPEKIKSKLAAGINMNITRNDIWLNIEDVAIYHIYNGNEIDFEPYENADMTMLKIFLTCSCMGFIMIQREKVAIHGGCIVINGKSVIITGDRGAGKSTLTTALRLKGYKFLADDVVGINTDDIIKTDFGFPYQKLCGDAMENFNYETSLYKSFMGDTKVKYMVPVHEDFFYDEVLLGGIIEISFEDNEYVQAIEVTGVEKLQRIIKNIYRGEFLPSIGGITPSYMKKCLRIAECVKYYRIFRPYNKLSIEDEMNEVENIFDVYQGQKTV